MPSLQIPASGLSFEAFSSKSTKSESSNQDIIGLTLTDGMIEEMIKCVQNGKPIQLSLGQHPNLSFGTTTQQLAQYQDPFAHELYQYDSSNSHSSTMPYVLPIGMPGTSFQRAMNPNWKASKPTSSVSQATTPSVKAVTASADAARDALEKSLAEVRARKKDNTTQLLNATLDPKRGPLKASNTSKFLAAQNRLTDSSRSMPSSPALSGIGSPSVAPTSVPASQVAAEQAKATRKPIIHILALGPLSERDLKEKLLYADLDDNLFEAALNKVADKDDSTKIYTLRQKNWKDLDVWCFNYDTEEDRKAVIEAAVKIYDRMRIPPNDDEWERLKPLETRGNGISLSKIQARIAQGPIPRTPRTNDSGLDTPAREGEEVTNKAINRVKKETKPRSSSQPPPAAKAKKVSEKETQPKRILTNKKKPAAAPRKELPTKVGGAKPLSNQYVNSESEEEPKLAKKAQPAKPAPAKPAAAPLAKAKRAREEEVASDASMAKKARVSAAARELKEKPAALPPKPKRAREEEVVASEPSQPKKKARTSDASQNSAGMIRSKGTSPQKSSPLASSPPTNASEFNSSSSDSSTPRHLQNHTLAHKRNTSSASSTTSSTNRVSAHILQMAAEYKVYHPAYLKLYNSLSVVEERYRDQEKWDDLMEMHKRLAAMKREIYESSRAS